MTIEKLRELEKAATPGPWRAILPGDFTWKARRGYRCVAFSKHRDETYTTSPLLPYDAALIAAMRNALPALLDVAEAARKALSLVAYADSVQASAGLPDRYTPLLNALAALDKLP